MTSVGELEAVHEAVGYTQWGWQAVHQDQRRRQDSIQVKSSKFYKDI